MSPRLRVPEPNGPVGGGLLLARGAELEDDQLRVRPPRLDPVRRPGLDLEDGRALALLVRLDGLGVVQRARVGALGLLVDRPATARRVELDLLPVLVELLALVVLVLPGQVDD